MDTFSLEKSEKYHKPGSSTERRNDPEGVWITLLGVAIAVVLVVTEILK